MYAKTVVHSKQDLMKSDVKFYATWQEFSLVGHLTDWLTSLWEIINAWTYDQHQLKIHQRLTELIVLGISYIPEYCDTLLPAQLFLFSLLLLLFFLFFKCLSSPVSFFLLSFFFGQKCSLSQRPHCSKRPIHEAGRQWREAQRALHTGYWAVSSALTPEGCVWAAPQTQWPRRLRCWLLPSLLFLLLCWTWSFC